MVRTPAGVNGENLTVAGTDTRGSIDLASGAVNVDKVP
jgi:hypothetical protein